MIFYMISRYTVILPEGELVLGLRALRSILHCSPALLCTVKVQMIPTCGLFPAPEFLSGLSQGETG